MCKLCFVIVTPTTSKEEKKIDKNLPHRYHSEVVRFGFNINVGERLMRWVLRSATTE